MKRTNEIVEIIDSHYVSDNYIQVMLGYHDYLLLFGNNDLMYFKNFKLSEGSKNVYLDDVRRHDFPYSSIPEHIERISLFKKVYFTNQILDLEKPYIRINDGLITKVTAFKDGDEAIFHTKILNNKMGHKKSKIVSRECLENYLNTGKVELDDENEYLYTAIFDMDGAIYSPGLEEEEEWIHREKERLFRIASESIRYMDGEREELYRAISSLDDISPFVLTRKLMIKMNNNSDIKLDYFVVKYLERGKYKIEISDLPVTVENLSMIKAKAELPVIKTLKEPKISFSLNPNITKRQLQKEKNKLLIKSK